MGMRTLWQNAGWTIAGFGAGGSLAGAAWFVYGVPLRAGELAALLFLSAAIAPVVALLLPLRRASLARGVAGASAWAAVAGFFGAPLALDAAPLPRATLLLLLGLVPAVAALIAMAGAAYLARGARRARARRSPAPTGK